MKKRFQLLVLSVLCAVFAHAQYVAPSEGVFRIINVGYNAALMEDFLSHNLYCTSTIGDNDDYEQLWVLETSGSGYSLQNLFTGAYIQTGNSGTEVNYWTGATAKTFKIAETDVENVYNIWDTGLGAGQGLHSKGANGNVVRWIDCNPSRWKFVKVDLTEEEIAAARAEYDRLTGGSKIEEYQALLDEVFADKACTVLSEAYAAKSVEGIETALTGKLPAELVAMAVKVKTGEWAEDNEKADKPGWDSDYAKKFRVQLVEPHSIAGEITEWIGQQGHTNMDNPTGIYANTREVLYVMVEGEVKEGAELWATWLVGHTKMTNYNNGYPNGIRLHSGLNMVPLGSDGSTLYINYLVHTYDKENKKFTNKLSNYDDLKIHIEGGYINGYYNPIGDALYTPDNDSAWVYYEDRANLENITIVGRYEVLQFELNDVYGADEDKETGEMIPWKEPEDGLAKLFPDMLPTNLPENQRINAIVEAWDRIFLSEKMTLGVASKAEVDSMNKLYPRWDATWTEKAEIYNYDDALYAFCDSLNDRDGDYGEYYNHRGVAFGTRTGYMYGSWDHSGYHINTTKSILLAIATEAGPTWGPAHEIGHQHQALYTLNGEMEVTNNTFANIAVWYMGMGTSRMNGNQGSLFNVYDNYRKGNFLLYNNIWALTHRYYRLWLYYHRAGNNTQFFPRLFELIRKNPMERSYGEGSEMRPNDKGVMENTGFQLTNGYRSYLHFYQLCCEAAQEDLTEFFRAYGCFVPVDGAFIGDYTNSKYYTTQKEIDKAIAEVKAKGYPENDLPLFINDCTPDKTYGHDGKTQRSYWDDDPTANWGAGYYPTSTGENAEVGCYVDFLAKNPITGEYQYTLTDLNIAIDKKNAKGAVGFAIYNNEGEIQAFSSHYRFSINEEVERMMRMGEATLYAIGADGNNVEIVNDLMSATPEEQLSKLKEALNTANAYLSKTDSTGLKIGYLCTDSVADYKEFVSGVQAVVDSADAYSQYKSYAEWYFELDAANIKVLTDKTNRVPFTPNCYYSFATSENVAYRIGVSTAGLNTSTKEGDNVEWKIVPAATEGTYYLQNRETSKYISVVDANKRAKAEASDMSGAAIIKFVSDAPGDVYVKTASGHNLYSRVVNGTQRTVNVGDEDGERAMWTILLVDNMLQQPDTIADDKMTLYYLQRTDDSEYANNITGWFNTGRISTDVIDAKVENKYWIYFTEGNEKGKYAIYNYNTGLSLSIKNNVIYANTAVDKTVDYTIELNEERNGLVIATEDGAWYMNGAHLNINPEKKTTWRLQRACYVTMAMQQEAAAVYVGQSTTLATVLTPEIAAGSVTWSSSNEEVAKVDAKGQVTGVAEGTATITATMGTLKATCEVTVSIDTNIDAATAGMTIQSRGAVLAIEGLAKGTQVRVYNTAGNLIASAVAANGAATIDTKLANGNTVIVKVGTSSVKYSL